MSYRLEVPRLAHVHEKGLVVDVEGSGVDSGGPWIRVDGDRYYLPAEYCDWVELNTEMGLTGLLELGWLEEHLGGPMAGYYAEWLGSGGEYLPASQARLEEFRREN